MAATEVNALARPMDQPKTPAAFDFRTDTITTPTQSMLQSMITSTLGDAVFEEDDTTSSFEAHVAKLLGHEQGLFVPSGTAGNQIAMRCRLTQPPHSVLCDHRAHVNTSEAGGLAILSQAMVQAIVPSNGIYLTLEDIKRGAVLEEDQHYAPTRVISLENTLGGTILPLKEVERIRAWASERNLKMHLDGARLWNACAAGAGSLSDYGRLFDSVTVCFSKGLGAPVGSVLVGSQAFIKRARWIRKSIGGGMRQTGTLTAAARTALDETYPKLAGTHAITKVLGAHFKSLGISLRLPVETNMIFMDLDGAGLKSDWLTEEGKRRGIKYGYAGRIVVHHQISEEAVQALKETVETVIKKKQAGEYDHEQGRADEGTQYGSLKK